MGRLKRTNPEENMLQDGAAVRRSPRRKTASKKVQLALVSSKNTPKKRGRPKRDQNLSPTPEARKSSTDDGEGSTSPENGSGAAVEGQLQKKQRGLKPNKKKAIAAATTANETASVAANGPAITEEEIMSIDSLEKLAQIMTRLVYTQQDQAFSEYRDLTRERIAQLEKENKYFQEQLLMKQDTIDTLASQIRELQSSRIGASRMMSTPQRAHQAAYELPIRKNKAAAAMIDPKDMEQELKTISFTFDMLELLTGARVINYEEDKEKFYFDIRQTDTGKEPGLPHLTIEYRLVIKRQNDLTAEVTYIPLFLKAMKTPTSDPEQKEKNKHAEQVQEHLPAYLRDNLKFPFNTLLQFSCKLSKALNKSGRSR
ncbi:hypothetical protein PUMCH_004784 [Australozyma saopauloensis]|uniref:Monopolin complex subunit Csm1/Pcs1 C-terminal domain-containing protein n=1 Tax=Australozyma saopauloensis TaxID=291208 RepID=A0AAX4HGL0_9ASCO|nr:hypothetical protein PUMCH_004784 [[Candida] saopauloensis]